MMLEREEGSSEQHFGEGPGAEEKLPTLFTLLHPMEEICSVDSLTPASASSLIPDLEPTSEPFADPAEQVVYTSSQRRREPPVIVTTNGQKGKISVWSYRRIEEDLTPKSAKAKGKERAASHAPATASSPVLSRSSHLERSTIGNSTGPPTVASNKRKRPSFAGPSSQGPISLGDRDRSVSTSRRISLSHGGNTSTAGEADLLQALGASSSAGMQRTASAMSSASIGMGVDRRTSVTRNELSVTMDRMALGVGSRDGHLGGLGGEMDREATMLFSPHEMHGEEERSDVELRKEWEMDLAGSG